MDKKISIFTKYGSIFGALIVASAIYLSPIMHYHYVEWIKTLKDSEVSVIVFPEIPVIDDVVLLFFITFVLSLLMLFRYSIRQKLERKIQW